MPASKTPSLEVAVSNFARGARYASTAGDTGRACRVIEPLNEATYKKRTPQASGSVLTKAKQIVMRPNPSEIDGIHHPGPTHLQAILDGISKTM